MWKVVRTLNNQNGAVMLLSLMVMSLLTLVGMSALSTSDVELAVAANTKANKMAYFNGEAGLEYTRVMLQNSLDEDVYTNPDGDDLDLEDIDDADEDSYITASYAAPTGYDFTSTVTVRGSYPGNIFDITSVGKGPDNAETTILASFVRSMEDGLNYGAFGDDKVEMHAGSAVYSYNSCDGETPDPSTSTGEGNIGSNNLVEMHDGTTVDGDVVLGVQDDGDQAELSLGGTQTISGDPSLELDEAEPSDPLNLLSSTIFTTMADDLNNDNDLITSGLTGTELTVSGTVTLMPGDYYFSKISFTGGGVLNIDTTSGDKVNIYLTGPLSTANSASINTTGDPTDFAIYSNSTESIDFRFSTDFKGLIYAPLASVIFRYDGSFYGSVFAATVDFRAATKLYWDECLGDATSTPTEPAHLDPLWWKEVRN